MDLSVREGFEAMVKFLENYYELTNSDDVGVLLGGMLLQEDGSTMDPAAWSDWLECIRKVKQI